VESDESFEVGSEVRLTKVHIYMHDARVHNHRGRSIEALLLHSFGHARASRTLLIAVVHTLDRTRT
jgi:hypothetical protein